MKVFYLRHKLILMFAMLAVNFGFAQDSISTSSKEHYKNQYFFSVGAFRPTVSTVLQVNGKRGPGLIMSLEENLGFSDKAWLLRGEASANFTKRSGMVLTFVQLNRKQNWETDRDVTIFDTTFNTGTKLGIYFNTFFVAASYKYSIFSRPEWEAGLSIGIRYLQIKTGVDLQSDNLNDYKESVSIPAPVPVFGIHGAAYMTERLRVKYNFDYFALEVSGIRGVVLDNRFALEYYFIKNLGLGANATFLTYQLKEMPLAHDFEGQVKYSLSGFSLYVTAKF